MSEEKVTKEQAEAGVPEDKTGVAPPEQQEAAEATAAETADAEEQTVSAVDWEQEAARWKALAEENQNRMLRALADMENMRKRMRKELEDSQKYASQKLIEELLPVLDNFERALAADKETMTVDSLLQGVDMVYRQMAQVFEREGLKVIEAKGKPFDPNVHQAVMQVQEPDVESGIVVEELQKGYLFKDRVIRPTMVKVNQ